MLLRKREMEDSGSRRKSGEQKETKNKGHTWKFDLGGMELKIPLRRGQ